MIKVDIDLFFFFRVLNLVHHYFNNSTLCVLHNCGKNVSHKFNRTNLTDGENVRVPREQHESHADRGTGARADVALPCGEQPLIGDTVTD